MSRWRYMNSLECCLYCDVYTTLNHDPTENYRFLSIKKGSRRAFAAGVDTVKGFNFAVLKFRDFFDGDLSRLF